MSPAEIFRELRMPVTNPSVLVAFLLFFFVIQITLMMIPLARRFPLIFIPAMVTLTFIVPAALLYLSRLLEWRAEGKDPQAPSADELVWINNPWSLIQLLYLLSIGYALHLASGLFAGVSILLLIVMAALLPALLGVLAITHSPLESLRPMAIVELIRRCGLTYLIPVVFLVFACVVYVLLTGMGGTGFLANAFGFYAVFVFYALSGAILRAPDLMSEISIDGPLIDDSEKVSRTQERERSRTINHAYALISRDNRAGGFKHIDDTLSLDDDPLSWVWYFEQMMRWEVKEPAAAYAQRHLGRLLQAGEAVLAVKIIMRCRLLFETFLPLPEDRELALEAAEHCRNDDLANSLRQSLR